MKITMVSAIIIGIVVLFVCPSTVHAGELVLNGKVYTLKEKEIKRSCGEFGGPEYQANLMLLNMAQGFGENTAKSACAAGAAKYCSKDEQVKFGVESVISFIRDYPSRFNSEGCAQLRLKCQQNCVGAKLFEAEYCLIECNQYQAYNR